MLKLCEFINDAAHNLSLSPFCPSVSLRLRQKGMSPFNISLREQASELMHGYECAALVNYVHITVYLFFSYNGCVSQCVTSARRNENPQLEVHIDTLVENEWTEWWKTKFWKDAQLIRCRLSRELFQTPRYFVLFHFPFRYRLLFNLRFSQSTYKWLIPRFRFCCFF